MDHPGVALPEQGAPALVASVVLARVVAVEPMERAGELVRGSLDDGVVVRAHDAIGMQRETCPSHGSPQVDHEEQAVAVVAEEHRLGDRVRRDVEEAGRQVGAADTSHPSDATREPPPETLSFHSLS